MLRRPFFHRWASALAGVFFVACGDSGTGPEPNPNPGTPPAVATVQVTPDSIDLVVGDTVRLFAILKAADGTVLSRPVTWSSPDGATATVDATGLVRARRDGRVVITALSEGKSGRTTVRVATPQETPPPAVATVEVSPSAVTLHVGQVTMLYAVLKAQDGSVITGRNVGWYSQDVLIAGVSPGGQVQALSVGRVKIQAISEGRMGEATVDVTAPPPPPPPPPVARVSVTPPFPVIQVGGSVQLRAWLEDANGNVLTDRTVEWGSMDSSIAAVDEYGRVTGTGRGRTTVFARSEGVTGATVVDVRAPITTVQDWELHWNIGTFYPSVGSAPWVDGQGVSHPATQELTAATITIDRSDPWTHTWEQRLVISTFVAGSGQPVAQRVEVDRGVLWYLFDGSGYALKSSIHEGRELIATHTGLGELTVRQQIGDAPVPPNNYRAR